VSDASGRGSKVLEVGENFGGGKIRWEESSTRLTAKVRADNYVEHGRGSKRKVKDERMKRDRPNSFFGEISGKKKKANLQGNGRQTDIIRAEHKRKAKSREFFRCTYSTMTQEKNKRKVLDEREKGC